MEEDCCDCNDETLARFGEGILSGVAAMVLVRTGELSDMVQLSIKRKQQCMYNVRRNGPLLKMVRDSK